MVGTMNEQQQAALALIKELHAMGAESASLNDQGLAGLAVTVTFARDQREHAPVDQGELLALRAENASLRDLIKAYQED